MTGSIYYTMVNSAQYIKVMQYGALFTSVFTAKQLTGLECVCVCMCVCVYCKYSFYFSLSISQYNMLNRIHSIQSQFGKLKDANGFILFTLIWNGELKR